MLKLGNYVKAIFPLFLLLIILGCASQKYSIKYMQTLDLDEYAARIEFYQTENKEDFGVFINYGKKVRLNEYGEFIIDTELILQDSYIDGGVGHGNDSDGVDIIYALSFPDSIIKKIDPKTDEWEMFTEIFSNIYHACKINFEEKMKKYREKPKDFLNKLFKI